MKTECLDIREVLRETHRALAEQFISCLVMAYRSDNVLHSRKWLESADESRDLMDEVEMKIEKLSGR